MECLVCKVNPQTVFRFPALLQLYAKTSLDPNRLFKNSAGEVVGVVSVCRAVTLPLCICLIFISSGLEDASSSLSIEDDIILSVFIYLESKAF